MLVTAVQVAGLVFVVVCGVVQYRHVFHLAAWTTSERTVYFKPATLVAAAAIALAIAAGLANERARAGASAL